MSQDQFNQTSLSGEDLVRFCGVLIEGYGHQIPRKDFADRVLLLLEDIAGFEFVSDSETQSIIIKLWSLYHDQSK